MNLRKLIFTNNRCYKAGRKIKPKGIMVHSTGANNPKLKRYVGPDDGLLGKNTNGNHWNVTSDDLDVCVHAFIGKLKDGTIATYQTLPWDHRGWHSGKGKNGTANDTHISFEICEDGLKDAAYFKKVYQEAVELCAYLCKMYNLTEKNIICHSEGRAKGIASNHADVMHWFPKHGKSMDTFRADVKALLGGADQSVSDEKTDSGESTIYRIRKSWSDAASQVGAYKSLAGAKDACPEGYTVYDEDGKAVYTKATAAAVGASTVKVELPVLRQGSKGEPVKALQRMLYSLGYDLGDKPVDGSYGVKTVAAVKKYQASKKLTSNGVVDEKTWYSLLGV